MNSIPYFTDAGNKAVIDITNILNKIPKTEAFLINNALMMNALEVCKKVATAKNYSEMILKIDTALEILLELANAIVYVDKMQKEK